MQNLGVAMLIPAELRRRSFQDLKIINELANRAFESIPDGIKQVQPWCRWQGLSQYLDCIAFADRAARELPTGRDLNLSHASPGRFYSVGTIFFAQALIDNVAVWLCDAASLPVGGGDRNFLSRRFKRELVRRLPVAEAELAKQDAFVIETNKYRQVWIHTISGGAIPTSDVNPFEYPETDKKFLGVPLDPAIHPDQENYLKRAEELSKKNGGPYLEEIGVFTSRVFDSTRNFYLGWLRLALDHIVSYR